jgi:putative flippase GtrA
MANQKKSKSIKKRNKSELERVIEYFAAGGAWFWSGYILIVLLDNHIGLFLANFVGNAVGITLNFILERYWVFKSKNPAKLGIAAKRYVVYTALNAFLLNYLILLVLENNGIKPEIGQFLAAGFFTAWNYFWYKFYVFKGIEGKSPRKTRHHA